MTTTPAVARTVKAFLQQALPPLIATGGPGASRVILFSASILFFSADLTAAFGGDFFLLMLLNTAFAQSFGFFLLKPDFQGNHRSIYRQSLQGLALSGLLCVALWAFGLLFSLGYSLVILVLLHLYYVLRYRFIALHRFGPLALAELLISLACLLGPWWVSQAATTVNQHDLYLIYALALALGLAVLLLSHQRLPAASSSNGLRPSLREVRNIAVSTTGGIFAVFILPAAIKQIATAEIVSVVALAVSCISISILLPRTYGNTILTQLANPATRAEQLRSIGTRYQALVVAGVVVAYVLTLAYLAVMGIAVMEIWWLPLMIALLILAAQSSFVKLTYLSLQNEDGYVARLNLLTLLGNAAYIGIALYAVGTTFALMIALAAAVVNFVLRNLFAQRYAQRVLAH